MSNLRLLCLLSLTNDGIAGKDYKSLKTQFVQVNSRLYSYNKLVQVNSRLYSYNKLVQVNSRLYSYNKLVQVTHVSIVTTNLFR